jgi:hypothetical protein
MTLRQAAFRAVAATVVVPAAAVAAVAGYGQRGSRGSVFEDLTARAVAQRIAPLIDGQLTIRI